MTSGAATLLLTGATGFVGGALLAEIFRSGAPFRPILLSRGADSAARLRASLYLHLGPAAAEALAKCTLIQGDLRSLESATSVPWGEISHVVHAAANTSFRSRNDVFATNVGGTVALLHKLRFARRLVRFLYVGTAYQCGSEAGPLIVEDDTPGADAPHLVEYTRSKARAEAALAEHAADLPIVIARPSVVAGHSALGLRLSASIFWYYRALATLNFAPFPPERRKDLVPVDHVAKALLFLLGRPSLAHRAYHISAGSTAESWTRIAAALATAYGIRHKTPPRLADDALLLERKSDILRACQAPDNGVLLSALSAFFTFGRYRAEVFDCGRLLAEGFPAPPAFSSYVARCAAEPGGRTIFEELQDEM